MTTAILSEKEAFLAMYAFLDKYYSLTRSDDVGGLLGSMSHLSDGSPADPAIQQDWNEAVQKALSGFVTIKLQTSK